MPKPSRRSRTLRRVFVKTPGGVTKIHYRKRKPSKPQCGACGHVLLGVSAERRHITRNLSKTKKRPERPFGGHLCSSCSRLAFTAKLMQ